MTKRIRTTGQARKARAVATKRRDDRRAAMALANKIVSETIEALRSHVWLDTRKALREDGTSEAYSSRLDARKAQNTKEERDNA